MTTEPAADTLSLACRFTIDTYVDVRHRIDEYLAGAGLSDFPRYRFLVAVNEIMTNVLRHGGGVGELRLWQDSELFYCQVTDRGPGFDPVQVRQRPGLDAEGGRGLWMAGRICSQLDIRSNPAGSDIILRYPRTDGPVA